jgi:universal stress protein E
MKLDKEILHMGRTISEGLRGTLHAVHAYARMPIGSVPPEALASGVMTPRLFKKFEQQARRSAQASLTRVLRTTRIARSRRYLVATDPIGAITAAARKSRSAIVVMGAVSRSGFKRLLVGNTAERILDDLSCDILVVKPLKFRNRVPRGARGARVVMTTPAGSLGYY